MRAPACQHDRHPLSEKWVSLGPSHHLAGRGVALLGVVAGEVVRDVHIVQHLAGVGKAQAVHFVVVLAQGRDAAPASTCRAIHGARGSWNGRWHRRRRRRRGLLRVERDLPKPTQQAALLFEPPFEAGYPKLKVPYLVLKLALEAGGAFSHRHPYRVIRVASCATCPPSMNCHI